MQEDRGRTECLFSPLVLFLRTQASGGYFRQSNWCQWSPVALVGGILVSSLGTDRSHQNERQGLTPLKPSSPHLALLGESGKPSLDLNQTRSAYPCN